MNILEVNCYQLCHLGSLILIFASPDKIGTKQNQELV